MNEDDRLLTAEDLAAFLDVPIKTLYAWRYRGEGPVGFRVGKHVRYRWTDVEQWIRDRVRVAEVRRSSDRTRTRTHVGDRR
ncbi:MAG: helix-turn-helix domain-containing protein [Acidimicrobiia bacterium]|nr:helix-turn-helix domain-containing protein [Acidimicrobiia bacterium]